GRCARIRGPRQRPQWMTEVTRGRPAGDRRCGAPIAILVAFGTGAVVIVAAALMAVRGCVAPMRNGQAGQNWVGQRSSPAAEVASASCAAMAGLPLWTRAW